MENTQLGFSNRSELKKYLKEKYNATDRDFIIFNANLGTTLLGLDRLTCFYYMRIFGSDRQKRICTRFIKLLKEQGAIGERPIFMGASDKYLKAADASNKYLKAHLDIFSEYGMKLIFGGSYASYKPIWERK